MNINSKALLLLAVCGLVTIGGMITVLASDSRLPDWALPACIWCIIVFWLGLGPVLALWARCQHCGKIPLGFVLTNVRRMHIYLWQDIKCPHCGEPL